jgi:hypothetical protein
MTYITIKNDHTLGARFLLLIVRLLGRNTADVDSSATDSSKTADELRTARYAAYDKEMGFGAWADDPRSTEDIIADIKGYRIGAL